MFLFQKIMDDNKKYLLVFIARILYNMSLEFGFRKKNKKFELYNFWFKFLVA